MSGIRCQLCIYISSLNRPRHRYTYNKIYCQRQQYVHEYRLLLASLDARVIDLNTNGAKELRDVGSRGGAVATDLEEEVRGDVTHLQERVPISFRQVFAYFASVLSIVYLAVRS